ncbi:hypothetical protein BJ944DRAFT_237336 [Cunninghamella echinulata]|nr:hypothetical protein BJ944DRAFT_237336 [Cunninghamella echinulata]
MEVEIESIMNESYWDKLKGEIHEKCVVYEYIDQSDMSLAEFIIGILQMGKSPDEVSRELSSLIGDDYEPQITQWIFSRLEELKNPSTTTSEYNNGNNFNRDNSNNDTNMTEENDLENKTTATTRQILPERRNRIFTQALDGLRQSDSKTSSLSSSYSRHGYSRSRSRSPEIYKERTSYRDRKENDIHSRLGGSKLSSSSSSSPSYSRHRYSSHSRSRSRSPERNKERVSFRDRKENDIHSRLGKKEASTSSSVFDRLGIQKPESIDEKPPRKRCKYWPTCEKGDDCTYIHPDTLCP